MGHAHPHAARQIRRFYDSVGIEFIENFDDVLDIADVYAADATSTIYEAAACGIPVVLLNAPYYRRDVHQGIRFWEAATIGPQTQTASELPGAITAALNPSPEQVAETERCLDLVYTHRDGTSAQRAVDAIHTHVLT
jgi:UDP-N-acetylglucosamine:LPS N-acetylglucosamine transferase